jgi:GNAT superfamily N-acetyltransferase
MPITQLEGFNVRTPRPEEMPAVAAWFAASQLGAEQCIVRAAFSRPGEVPLGAVIVRPSEADARVGQFTLFVRPDCRRHGIGRFLVRHLYQLALANNAGHLALAELVHQDAAAENAFCRALGMSADMALGTYELDMARQVLPVCEPIARRFVRSHPHLRGVRVVGLADLADHDLDAVARFLTAHYSGFVEQQTARLRAGFFDRNLSTVAVRDGSEGGGGSSISAINLMLAKPNDPAIYLDLVLTDPATRNGPTPLVLFTETARRALAAGKTTAVFEADARHDPFAVGFAERCGVTTPKWYRYRYSIAREQMMQVG